MDSTESDEILKENFKTLKFLKLWPNKKDTLLDGMELIKTAGVLLWLGFLFFGSILHFVHGVLVKESFTKYYIEDSVMILTGCGYYYIMICFLFKQKKISILVESIKDFTKFRRPVEFVKTNKSIGLAVILYKYYTLFGTLIYSSFAFLKANHCEMDKIKHNTTIICGLTSQTWLPFDIEYVPAKQIYFVMQTTSAVLITQAAAAIFSFVFAITEHLILKIKDLRNLLKNCLQNGTLINKKQTFRFCIQYHIHIIKISEQINDCFEPLLFVNVSLTAIIIGVIGFQFLLEQELNVMIHFFAWIITLFTLCLSGQRLINENSILSHEAYSMNWCEVDVSIQKDVKMFIMRSQKPLCLRAGIGIMSLATFQAIIKTAYSYLTLLKQKY